MFKLVQKLGALVVRLYRAEATRLVKQADAQAKDAESAVQSAQELLRRSDDMVQASRESRLSAQEIHDKANQMENLF